MFPTGIMAPLDPAEFADISDDFYDLDDAIASVVPARGRRGG
jgi:hypothetical protein